MRSTHRIIGCTLCVAVMGSAAAAGFGTQDSDHVTQVTSSRAAHGSENGDGDTIAVGREDSIGASSASSEPATSRNGNDRSGATSSAPAPTPRPRLGWQSLLPGSIQ